MIFEVLYQAGIWFLGMGMRIGALFNHKIARGVAGRQGLMAHLEATFQENSGGKPVAWFHAASLGEFEQGRPVIESFRASFPEFFIVLTFFSPSGYEVRKNYAGADYICYLPLDSEKNAQRFLDILRPRIAFFIKYEFWFNYLKGLRQRDAAIISFSAIFRPDQIFFKPYGGFYRKLLAYFDRILVQNEESRMLLNRVGITDCTVAGDTRFDRVKSIASAARELPEITGFMEGAFCIVAGSVWQADMDVLIPVLNSDESGMKAIIAPHEIKPDQIEGWRDQLKGRSVLYSVYIKDYATISADYLIIDNVGMLSSLYRYADVAFIGGGFGSGLHNILEAATFGIPVIFGNNKYQKFQEALDLIALGGAVAVKDQAEAASILGNLMADETLRASMGGVNASYVLSGTGATERVIKEARRLLKTK